MTTVTLYGHLGRVVGKRVWDLDVNSPGEALRAIEANTNKLYSHLKRHLNGEALYAVYVNGKPVNAGEQLVLPIKPKTIEFIPVLAGAGMGDILMFVGIGLLLVAAALFAAPALGLAAAGWMTAGSPAFSATAMWVASTTLAMGASLVLGGLVSMLSPSPNMDISQSPEHKASYIFSGAVNTMNQGLPVPVGYGELVIGSAVISVGITSTEIPV